MRRGANLVFTALPARRGEQAAATQGCVVATTARSRLRSVRRRLSASQWPTMYMCLGRGAWLHAAWRRVLACGPAQWLERPEVIVIGAMRLVGCPPCQPMNVECNESIASTDRSNRRKRSGWIYRRNSYGVPRYRYSKKGSNSGLELGVGSLPSLTRHPTAALQSCLSCGGLAP